MARQIVSDDEDMEDQNQEQGGDLAYDPDQDREEKREVRRGYRQLHDDENLQNPSAVGIESLTTKVLEANKLFQKVKGPQEATLDSAFLVTASNLGAAKARQMRSDASGFDIDDFIGKLVTFMGGRKQGEQPPSHANPDSDGEEDYMDDEDRPLQWDKIGRKALAKSRRVPTLNLMLGPLSVEVKKRNVTKRAKLNKEAEEEKKPKQLNQDDIKGSENETTKNVLAITKILEQQEGPVNLFRFIVNPKDFGQTVENMFYLSFLIRDSKCFFELDEEGEPIIFLCDPPTEEQYAKDNIRRHQMVMEMDIETWKRAIEVFDIREPMIPTRRPSTI